jgi:pimeloyl-ACP methyl ester carboxylesterase
VRVPGAGHLTPLEAPGRIKEELLVFLAGLDSPSVG